MLIHLHLANFEVELCTALLGSSPTVRATVASKLHLLGHGTGQLRTENRLIERMQNSF